MVSSEGNGGNMVMPVSPMGAYGGNGGGWGGDNGWWIILVLLLAANGWGNNGGWGGGNGGGAMPYVLNQGTNADVQRGFDQAATTGALSALQASVNSGFGDTQTALCSGFGNLQTALCGGFAGVNATVNNAQNALAQQLYANQLADLNRSFDAQTAITAGMTGIAQNLQNCCCENRANIADLKYTVATENCADRAALSEGVRDIITNATANTQNILDKLCQLELDSVKGQLAQAQRENAALQNAVNMATMRESQTAQTAAILQGQNAEVEALYDRLSQCPVPSTPVYGRTPIFTCNNGCGCNGNGLAA